LKICRLRGIQPRMQRVCRAAACAVTSGTDNMPAQTPPMSPREAAIAAEAVDTDNWFDSFAAAPPPVRDALALGARRDGALAMVRSRIPFSHFNMVLTLGCPAPADDAAFAAIDRFYAEAGVAKHWVMVNDHSEPADLDQRLLARGYAPAGAWDRVILRGARPDLWAARAAGCETVTSDNAADWSAFILKSYGMPPPIAHWLHALVGRKRWFHALRREGGRPGAPVAMVRSLYLADNGWAWLGIDAPVPGVMAPCFDDDQKVTAHLLQAASAGAHSFVSDIEVPSPERSGPAYQRWEELGFTAAYLRRLFSRG
jgi:hypothetical protein